MVYKFRIILDNNEDVFRDIAIQSNTTLEDLHNAIINSFGFDGAEVGSFYTCTGEWEQEDEIPQFDMGETPGEQSTMANFILEDILDEKNTKIIYVYDFLNMWTFYVELAAIEEEESLESYPITLFSVGQIPDESSFEITEQAPPKSKEENDDNLYAGGYIDDNADFEDLGYEENWN